MTGKLFLAIPVRIDNAFVYIGRTLGRPGQQCGPEVITNFRIVIDDACDAMLPVKNAGGQIRRVALGGDALVPIVIRVCRILQLYLLEPWIFAGRLIEMAMNAKISHPIEFRSEFFMINAPPAKT